MVNGREGRDAPTLKPEDVADARRAPAAEAAPGAPAGRPSPGKGSPPKRGSRPPGAAADSEREQLISTLRAVLDLGGGPEPDDVCPRRQQPPQSREARGSPLFLRPDGHEVVLPVGERDSLSYRIEALRVYLEQELGLDDFLYMYRYLNESARPDETTLGGERGGQPLESRVARKAISFLPLVHQLIVCEDECFAP